MTCSTATGPHLLGHQSRQTFVQSHAKRADALRTKPERRGQHQVGAVRFQQIGRTDIGLKAPGDQGHDVHQSLGRLAALGRQIADFLQGQDVIFILRGSGLAHVLNYLVPGIN